MSNQKIAHNEVFAMSFISKNRLILSFFTGFFLHGILFFFLFTSKPHQLENKTKKKIVEIRLVEKKKTPISISKKEIENLKNTIDPITKKEEPKKVIKKNNPPEEKKSAKKQSSEKSKNLKPRKFSISMEATVAEGTVGVRATTAAESFAFGSTEGDSNAPKEKVVYDSSDPSAISSLPILEDEPSSFEMQKLYPEAAKREGQEANVKLRLLIDEAGRVSQIEIIEEAGFGFDEVALTLAKKFKFKPAQKNGEPVSVWIPWTYKFRLEES